MHLEETIVAVGFARQQALQLELLGADLQLAERALCFLKTLLVLFLLGQLGQVERILELAFEVAVSADRLIEPGALLHDRLGGLLIIPQLGVFGARVQLFQILDRLVEVKDASSAEPWTA